MRDVFIINPAAGKEDCTKVLTAEIREVYGDNCKILITTGEGDALVKAKAEAETGDDVRIFACGGDGTSFEVLNGIVGYKNAAIGVIPIGSANDFIKYFGFDSKPRFLNLKKQKNGTLLPIDLIKAGDKYCMNQCCAGLDAQVADFMKGFKRLPLVSGPMAYNLAVVKAFLGKIGINMKVITDGKIFKEGSVLFAVCANAPVYGGGYISAPKAVLNDGQLDCVTIDTVKKLQVPGLLPKYKSGQHEKLDVCTYGRCESFEFQADVEIPVSLDGEIIHTKSFKCEIVKNGINFVLPE
ncbi:MAG: YegS/Rv2252/BmrU family lipid kinase [Clostridia bacterium]|nr:YegS/Rv2252/BmrU family lipid kinase [Clostridia bacterium]